MWWVRNMYELRRYWWRMARYGLLYRKQHQVMDRLWLM